MTKSRYEKFLSLAPEPEVLLEKLIGARGAMRDLLDLMEKELFPEEGLPQANYEDRFDYVKLPLTSLMSLREAFNKYKAIYE